MRKIIYASEEERLQAKAERLQRQYAQKREKIARMSPDELAVYRKYHSDAAKAYQKRNPEKCRERCRMNARRRRAENPEAVKLEAKTWLANNRESAAEKKKEYISKNIGKFRELYKKYYRQMRGVPAKVEEDKKKRRERYQKNRESILLRRATWRSENRNKDRAYKGKWRENNRAYEKAYKAKRLLSDPAYKAACLIRGRIYKAIKSFQANKKLPSLSYLGCSIPELLDWIQSQFKPGMNWGNNTNKGWHIDHKIPVCKFDLTDEAQIAKCFHYTNLQPLWWWENLQKGSRVEPRLKEEYANA